MPDLNREVAGLRCRDVLSMLGDYVDGELAAGDVARVGLHLQGCDQCEKFGGEYGALVRMLRVRLATVGGPDISSEHGDAEVLGRLARRIDTALSQDRR
jgi:anti-sigma factor RsiW